MMSWSACLQRSATDKLGPPVSARPVVSYTTPRDIIIARHHGIPPPRVEAKQFCYQVMECRGWIARRAPAISGEVMA